MLDGFKLKDELISDRKSTMMPITWPNHKMIPAPPNHMTALLVKSLDWTDSQILLSNRDAKSYTIPTNSQVNK